MSKLNIIQVLWNLGRAGAERMVLDLSTYLHKNEQTVNVIAASGGGAMEEDFERADIDVTVLPPSRLMTRWTLPGRIEKRLKEISPDIVHTHLGGDVWGGKAAKALGIPWLLTAHSQEGDMNFHQRFGRAWAYAHADHVVAVSKSVSEAVRKRHRLDPSRISIIPIGLDLSRFVPRPPRLPSDVPRLVSVGRLVSLKGHDVLLRALANIKTPWRLELVGSGEEYLSLSRLAESLGIRPRILFRGEVSDVAPYLAEADLFCFPSWREGQGLALYEAAASRLPVISSRLPALLERFDERMVRYVPAGDVDAWEKAIRDALLDYGTSLRMAEAAYAEVKAHYTLDAMGDAYLALYKKLLGKKRGS